jgi:hypothetical protein
MDYHEFLNRQVLLFTAVALIERVRGLWGGGYRGLSRSAASAGQLPAR